MQAQIAFGSTGTPLYIVTSNDLNNWLEQQPQHARSWINSCGFEGTGLCTIPGTDGSLEQAVFVTDSTDELFACAELANLLPKQAFQLMADPAVQKNAAIAFGLAQYKFDRYKKVASTQAILLIDNQDTVDTAHQFINAICLVRDMINTPAADMMPEHMSELVQTVAKEFGATFSEIIGDDLLTQNFPTIHTVGRASVHQPRLLDLHWGQKTHPKITLVGKGVCFDSGGLDLKPASAMRNMKKDMGGAAHVMGLAHLIMSHNLPIQLRVIIPSVENAVSSNAFRPGDVLTTRNGITVEIDNTDAEGRLVLCDALAEACNDKPELILDFATLTGACRVALGTELPGFFSTDNSVAVDLMNAGAKTEDPVWQLPLHKPYLAMLKSNVADLTNNASTPFGGAITAALYLNEFVDSDIPWVHFDVMAWNNRHLPGRPIGGEAMGVRAVFELLRSRYADK
jgi:leucyl aminopeptidase